MCKGKLHLRTSPITKGRKTVSGQPGPAVSVYERDSMSDEMRGNRETRSFARIWLGAHSSHHPSIVRSSRLNFKVCNYRSSYWFLHLIPLCSPLFSSFSIFSTISIIQSFRLSIVFDVSILAMTRALSPSTIKIRGFGKSREMSLKSTLCGRDGE